MKRSARGALAAMVAALALGIAGSDARAQCSSGASSCVGCHEAQRARSVLDDGRPWHADHAFGDLCASCHGGDRTAADADAAHSTMHDALAEDACSSCHDDAHARLARYLAAPSPPAGPSSRGPDRGASASSTTSAASMPLLFAAVALAVGIGLLVARRRGRHLADLGAWIRAPRWTPHAAGALLGLAVAASYALRGRPISVSGVLDSLSGWIGAPLAGSSIYWGSVVPIGIDERFFVVVGLFFGALLSSAYAGTLRARWLPDRGWTERFGPARRTRLALAFVGALLVQLGAGIAGGCTSGLAISGGALLSPAAFVFMAGMFAGGIPVAFLAARRMRRTK